MVTEERRKEYIEVCDAVVRWASARPDIMGVAIVGSWARSEPRMDSDIDVVLLTTQTAAYSHGEDWTSAAVSQPAKPIRTQQWGPLTEHRIRVPSGLEIEFGIAPTSWAATDPIDAGTAGVVSNGCIAILDREGLIQKLVKAVAELPTE